MPALIPLLLTLAPTVADWIFGDKTGAAVGKVTGLAKDILGTDDPGAVERAIAADPNLALQFKMAVMQAAAEAKRADLDEFRVQLADMASARNQTVELAKANSKIAWSTPVVSVLAIVVFAGFVAMLFFRDVPEGMKEALLLLGGSAATGYGMVLSYWLGSSSSSAAKDSMIRQIAGKP